MTNRTFKNLVATAALVGVWGCGSIDDINPFTEKQVEAPPPCPSVSILADSERITVFRQGIGQDLTDVDMEAQIDDFVANCIYDVDAETGIGQIDIELSLGVVVARGPANISGVAEVPYFVTLTTYEKELVSKGIFSIPVSFEGNRYRLSVFDEPVVLNIPIEPPKDGFNYRVYVGLQLTPEQLLYNQTVKSLPN